MRGEENSIVAIGNGALFCDLSLLTRFSCGVAGLVAVEDLVGCGGRRGNMTPAQPKMHTTQQDFSYNVLHTKSLLQRMAVNKLHHWHPPHSNGRGMLNSLCDECTQSQPHTFHPLLEQLAQAPVVTCMSYCQ